MVNQICTLLYNSTYWAVSLCTHLFNSTGTWSLVLGAITIYLLCKLILAPILGFSGASDVAGYVRSKTTSKRDSNSKLRQQ